MTSAVEKAEKMGDWMVAVKAEKTAATTVVTTVERMVVELAVHLAVHWVGSKALTTAGW